MVCLLRGPKQGRGTGHLQGANKEKEYEAEKALRANRGKAVDVRHSLGIEWRREAYKVQEKSSRIIIERANVTRTLVTMVTRRQ